jgi:hypothetical protein
MSPLIVTYLQVLTIGSIEFNVGILAACLGTLKPLFNWFLETARAMTAGSSHRGKYGYGSNYKRHSSLGYLKQYEAGVQMDNLSARVQNADNTPKQNYNVMVSSGRAYRKESNGSGASSPSWEPEIPSKSEDNILTYEKFDKRGIVRTTEVKISQGH